ncbi:MAG TPA: hypothetical protein VFF28_00875 [Candidatus Nanoarchaeia archaeon]|nr:hypothetical protein [Candidatus Nanoarchaeia archaeon]
MKKGQSLSLNTIIIAAIVLIVLIVLWAIFTGRMGKFTTDLAKEGEVKTCEKMGGVGPQEPPCDTNKKPVISSDTTGTTVCCVP